jgi:peptide/nickel transport system ATP-binding protein
MTSSNSSDLLQVRNVSKHFSLRHGLFSRTGPALAALDDVSITIRPGQIFGLVGESGSGKSTLGRTILQLTKADSGSVHFHGQDLCTANASELNIARKKLQVIFQDPSSSLNPRRSIRQSLLEPLDQFGIGEKRQRESMCQEALNTVGLDTRIMDRMPRQLSSGQRQRVGIARAVLTKPDLIIADEAVSALDVSVQAQVLELIRKLRSELGIAFLFISHDLAVISQLADTVAVMFRGKIVESAPVDTLFGKPSHPYTQELLAAVPSPDPSIPIKAVTIRQGLSREAHVTGCAFASRCASVMPQCRNQAPGLASLESNSTHHVRCHLYTASLSE